VMREGQSLAESWRPRASASRTRKAWRQRRIVGQLAGLSNGSWGSGPASRFGNLTAGLLSFELDCEIADFRENPGSAIEPGIGNERQHGHAAPASQKTLCNTGFPLGPQ